MVHSSGKTDRIYMKGPGGRGEVEVAVSGVAGKKAFYAWGFQNLYWHAMIFLASLDFYIIRYYNVLLNIHHLKHFLHITVCFKLCDCVLNFILSG